jgi:hypothetical protein
VGGLELEAERIRSSSFQAEHLAREYVALLNEAGERIPLLLLILGSDPPVPVKGAGRLSIEEAVELSLDAVLTRYPDGAYDRAELLARIPDVFSGTQPTRGAPDRRVVTRNWLGDACETRARQEGSPRGRWRRS